MKKTIKLILASSLLFTSMSAFAFNFSSRDFGMGDDDNYGDNWDNDGPWKMSSGRWNTGPMGGGPFNTDSRNLGAAPWNFGNRNNNWGNRNSPWSGGTPWSGNSSDWGGSREPWNRSYRGYANPYRSGPYGGYGNPYQGSYGYPYNAGQAYPPVPVTPPAQ